MNVIKNYGNSDGIEINNTYSSSNTVDSETAKQIAETVSNATTKSSAWTLSSDWNKLYSATNETDEVKGKTTVRTDSEGNVTGGNYFVSNSNGGSSYVSTSSGGSSSNSAKVTTAESVGINSSYDKQTEKYADVKLSASNTLELGASATIPVKFVDIGVSAKNTTTVGTEANSGRKDNTAVHYDDSYSGYVGTYNESNNSAYYDTTSRSESNWNTTSGYEKSYQTSKNTEISNAINEQITNKTSYNVQDAIGGSESKNETDTTSTTIGNEYVNTVRFNEQQKTTETVEIKQSAKESGYYRIINAGTVHVFAIVGYDVATQSYFTYTYNVLDDERHPYLDFSLNDPNFKDCQNGVVNFEVPYYVNEYVMAHIGKTNGLQIGLDGIVTAYNGTDTTVVIPQYDSADNMDSTASAIKVKSFTDSVFKNNKNIKTVVLPEYITEIPDNAFEGCTNLETVISLGVTKIGNNAFKDCVNLKSFSIDNKVTELGENAFENVSEVMVNAVNKSVADNTINCGAKRITLNISKVAGTYADKVITINNDTEYFALYSDGKSVKNLQVNSSANETVINNIVFEENKDTPLIITSSKVTLNRVVIDDAPGFAIILKKDNTELNLYSDVVISSQCENALLCKNVTLKNLNPKVTCSLSIYNKALVCGKITNTSDYLKSGEIVTITSKEFDRYLTSCIVSFNANGGEMNETTKNVYYGQQYGILPTPTKEGFEFDGWYTAESGGEKITSETVLSFLANHTLFAHWTVNSYTATWSGGTGYTITVNRTSSPNKGASTGQINSGSTVYYGDVLSISYQKNDYYFITSSGKTSITVTSNINSGDIYASAKLNEVSGWTKASSLPSGADVIETKWQYTLREYTTNSASSLSGWTKYDTKRTSWGPTQGAVYSDPSNGVRNVWSEQYVASRTTHYVYYHRYNGSGAWSDDKNAPNWARHSGPDVTSKLPNGYYSSVTGQRFSGAACAACGATNHWHLDRTYTVDNYATRWYYQEPVYTYYYYRDLSKETTSGDPTGQANVSNVVKYVKYRAK